MKFNTKTRYGLRTMIELAMDTEKRGLFQKEISKRQNISEKYLDQIISILKIAGLIKNIRGKKSGYVLVDDPGNITIMDIITAFEPEHAIVGCLRNAGTCGRSDGCAARVFWESLNRTINDFAASVTLKVLAENEAMFRMKGDFGPGFTYGTFQSFMQPRENGKLPAKPLPTAKGRKAAV